MKIENHFNRFFQIQSCHTPAAIAECQRIRYRAYCVDRDFLNATDYADSVERDAYDSHSAHSLIRHKQTGTSIATVRLVLSDRTNEEKCFPIESFKILRRMKRDNKWRVPRKSIGEISRFAICKEFRRRIEERDSLHGISDTTFTLPKSDRRCSADITLGLFKAIVQESFDHDLTHWYAVMEPSLIRLLGRFGIRFCEVGPPVEYHGIRQPCIAFITNVLSGIHVHNEDIWNFITNEGQYYGRDYIPQLEDEMEA